MPKLYHFSTPTGNVIRELTANETDPTLKLFYIIDKETNDNLPSWFQVSNAIDNANSVPEIKLLLKKIARVLYLLAKNSNI